MLWYRGAGQEPEGFFADMLLLNGNYLNPLTNWTELRYRFADDISAPLCLYRSLYVVLQQWMSFYGTRHFVLPAFVVTGRTTTSSLYIFLRPPIPACWYFLTTNDWDPHRLEVAPANSTHTVIPEYSCNFLRIPTTWTYLKTSFDTVGVLALSKSNKVRVERPRVSPFIFVYPEWIIGKNSHDKVGCSFFTSYRTPVYSPFLKAKSGFTACTDRARGAEIQLREQRQKRPICVKYS